jgi:hypothetical protein
MLVSDLTFSFRLNEVLIFENKLQHELRYIPCTFVRRESNDLALPPHTAHNLTPKSTLDSAFTARATGAVPWHAQTRQ